MTQMDRRDDFFDSMLAATETVRRAVYSVPDEVWQSEPEGRFGPGDSIAHIIQTEGFFLSFVLPTVKLAEPFILRGQLKAVAAMENRDEKRRVLSSLNLAGARKLRNSFESLGALQRAWKKQHDLAFDELDKIHPDLFDTPVEHPLVTLSNQRLIVVANVCFIQHSIYHAGQITSQLKEMGLRDHVAFPIGDI